MRDCKAQKQQAWLVAETGAITFATNGYTVRGVTDIAKGPGWISAKLRLEGTSETVQARFRFEKPEQLRVTLSFGNGIPAEIREEFADRGEHYYGYDYTYDREAQKLTIGFQGPPS